MITFHVPFPHMNTDTMKKWIRYVHFLQLSLPRDVIHQEKNIMTMSMEVFPSVTIFCLHSTLWLTYPQILTKVEFGTELATISYK